MIQAIGRLIQRMITTITFVHLNYGVLALVAAAVGGRRDSGVFGRNALCVYRICEEFPANSRAAPTGPPAHLGGSKEAAKELKLFGLKGFLTDRLRSLSSQVYEEDVTLARRKAISGFFLSAIGTKGLLYGLSLLAV